MSAFTATFESRDALGHVRYAADMQGDQDYMAAKLSMIVEAFVNDCEEGDQVMLTIGCDLPSGHPLTGIDLLA